MPVYTIVGGVNGVGKSSLTGALRAVCGNLGVVVDPDRLIAQCGGDAYAGGQLAVQRLESALAAGADFTQGSVDATKLDALQTRQDKVADTTIPQTILSLSLIHI